jgi:hypothetical protein
VNFWRGSHKDRMFCKASRLPGRKKHSGPRGDIAINKEDPDHASVPDDALVRKLCSGGSGMGDIDD